MKSLYHLRSKSVQRASFAGGEIAEAAPVDPMNQPARPDYEKRLACQ